MSKNPLPFFEIKVLDEPKNIEIRVPLLIRLYLARPHLQTSRAIVAHLNAILAAPHYINDMKTRCQFRQLAEHWRLIVWLDERSEAHQSSQKKSLLKIELKQIQHSPSLLT
ncbi:MAG: hypothetical protein KAG26_02700 [Methylococcales bacterium]|nr:hypothetical protein [Methylococcales bacterium]